MLCSLFPILVRGRDEHDSSFCQQRNDVPIHQMKTFKLLCLASLVVFLLFSRQQFQDYLGMCCVMAPFLQCFQAAECQRPRTPGAEGEFLATRAVFQERVFRTVSLDDMSQLRRKG